MPEGMTQKAHGFKRVSPVEEDVRGDGGNAYRCGSMQKT
jgi:hypothetical protein